MNQNCYIFGTKHYWWFNKFRDAYEEVELVRYIDMSAIVIRATGQIIACLAVDLLITSQVKGL